MPYPVKLLFANLGEPIIALPDEPISDALNRMLKHDYSQLPVIQGTGQSAQFFLITTDTIVQALSSIGATTSNAQLRVSHALKKVSKTYNAEDDIFELMTGIAADSVALVVDENRCLSHIVTSYDTTVYFRQWSEDIMYAREIENSLKKYINATFKMADGTVNEQSRQQAIDDITSSNRDLRRKFDRALVRYLKDHARKTVNPNSEIADAAFLTLLTPTADEGSRIQNQETPTDKIGDQHIYSGDLLRQRFNKALANYLSLQAATELAPVLELADDAFLEIYNPKEKPSQFRDLTLDQLITLFCQDTCWRRYAEALSFEKEQVKFLLDGVRTTRNNLAHFREEEITAQHRVQLKRCAEWLVVKEKEALSG